MTYEIQKRPTADERVATAESFLLGKAAFFLKRAENSKDASAKLELFFASKAMTDAVRILLGKKVMK